MTFVDGKDIPNNYQEINGTAELASYQAAKLLHHLKLRNTDQKLLKLKKEINILDSKMKRKAGIFQSFDSSALNLSNQL